MTEREKNIRNLEGAVWQVLDDMGEHGTSCCEAAKAQLRIAFEPFLQQAIADDPELNGDAEPEMTLEAAQAIMRSL
jgi:hypothetical protein